LDSKSFKDKEKKKGYIFPLLNSSVWYKIFGKFVPMFYSCFSYFICWWHGFNGRVLRWTTKNIKLLWKIL
jgi:hypothetical protein